MYKMISVLVILFFCSGCPNSLSETMDSWMGVPVDRLVSSWGAPSRVYDTSDGGKVLTWLTTWSNQYGVYTCTKSFTADKDGYLQRWTYNNCP